MGEPAGITEFDHGLFSATAFWVMDEVSGKVLYSSATWYKWALVECIQDWPTPSPYEEEHTPTGPKCLLLYDGGEVKIKASAAEVFAGWQKYYAGKAAREMGPSFKSIGRN